MDGYFLLLSPSITPSRSIVYFQSSSNFLEHPHNDLLEDRKRGGIMSQPEKTWIHGPRASGKTKILKGMCWRLDPSQTILCITPWVEEKNLWMAQWEKFGDNRKIEIHTPESLSKKMLENLELTDSNWQWFPSNHGSQMANCQIRRSTLLQNKEITFDLANDILNENLDQIAVQTTPWDWIFYDEPEERTEEIQQWISQIPFINQVVASKWQAPEGYRKTNLDRSYRGISDRGERMIKFKPVCQHQTQNDGWIKKEAKARVQKTFQSGRLKTNLAIITGRAKDLTVRKEIQKSIQRFCNKDKEPEQEAKIWVLTPPELEGKVFDSIIIEPLQEDDWGNSKKLTEAWLDLACSKSKTKIIAGFRKEKPPNWLRHEILPNPTAEITYKFSAKIRESLCQNSPLNPNSAKS